MLLAIYVVLLSINQVFSHEGAVVDAVDFKDVPLAELADQGGVRRVKKEKKAGDLCEMSREGLHNPVPKNSVFKGAWIFTKEMLQ